MVDGATEFLKTNKRWKALREIFGGLFFAERFSASLFMRIILLFVLLVAVNKGGFILP